MCLILYMYFMYFTVLVHIVYICLSTVLCCFIVLYSLVFCIYVLMANKDYYYYYCPYGMCFAAR